MKTKSSQLGFLSLVAVLLIMIMGFLGLVIAYMVVSSATSTNNIQQAEMALDLGDAGLEQAVHELETSTLSNRITCSGLSISNTLGAGAYSVSSSGPFFVSSPTSLNGALTASATTITVNSTSGYQSSGRIMIDRELINYTNIDSTHFNNATRGADGSTASSHATGALVAQSQCNLTSQGGVPSLSPASTTLGGKRSVTENAQVEEGWAAGLTLTGPVWNMARWNNPTEKTWTQQAAGAASPQNLNAVSAISNVDVWIVGNNATALHFNGSSWTNVSSGISGAENLVSVSAISSSQAWTGDGKGNVYKWTGGASWTMVASPGNSVNGLSMLDTTGSGTASVGWAVGTKKTAFLYNGTTWTSTNTGVSVDLNSVSTLSGSDAWAAGLTGHIFQWTGGASWNTISTPSALPTLNSISMMKSGGSDIGWAVGTSSTAWFYNGTSWASSNTGLPGSLTLTGVKIVSSNEAWLTDSNDHIYEWNGSTWTLVFTAGAGLNGLDIIHPATQPFSAWKENVS